jgi:FixJ family two-component response regulator
MHLFNTLRKMKLGIQGFIEKPFTSETIIF